jgi:hypothetical protein
MPRASINKVRKPDYHTLVRASTSLEVTDKIFSTCRSAHLPYPAYRFAYA